MSVINPIQTTCYCEDRKLSGRSNLLECSDNYRVGDRKIAFLTPEYLHPNTGNSGGIGTSIKNLAVGLLAQGFECSA